MISMRHLLHLVFHFAPPFFSLFVIAPLFWWSIDDMPPLTTTGATIAHAEVPRGGTLIIDYEMNYTRMCSADVRRVFVDSGKTEYPIEMVHLLTGYGRDHRKIEVGPQTVRLSAEVPYAMAPGSAKYQAITEFFCNPLQRLLHWGIIYKFPAVDFVVLDAYAPRIEQRHRDFSPYADQNRNLAR